MTDDSEVREGDVRLVEMCVTYADDRCVDFAPLYSIGSHDHIIASPEQAAASRLISRKAREIKVGSRVERKSLGFWRVVAIDDWSRLAWVTPDESGFALDDEIVPLSDLTLVEDPTDV